MFFYRNNRQKQTKRRKERKPQGYKGRRRIKGYNTPKKGILCFQKRERGSIQWKKCGIITKSAFFKIKLRKNLKSRKKSREEKYFHKISLSYKVKVLNHTSLQQFLVFFIKKCFLN